MIIQIVTSVILFFGGIACIVTSINIKTIGVVNYDMITYGTVTYINTLALAFNYIYNVNNQLYNGSWLPSTPYENTTQLLICYSNIYPECSTLPSIPGLQQNYFDGICATFSYKSPWFWPILMCIGIIFMSVGAIFGSMMINNKLLRLINH